MQLICFIPIKKRKLKAKLDKQQPNLHKIEFKDSHNHLVDTLTLDTNVYRLTTYKRTKTINKEVLEKWLADNGIFNKHQVYSYSNYRRDGFDISIPSLIRLETEVPDDRNLVSIVNNETHGMSGSMLEYLRIFSVLSKVMQPDF